MNTNGDEECRREHPLAEVAGLAPETVAALKKHWLGTAEQALAGAATPEGRAGLKRLLGFDEAQLEGLLATLTAAVGSEAAARLRQPAPGGSRGMILNPEQQQRSKNK